MSQSRSERACEGHSRAVRAKAGGKGCANAYISFVRRREAFLEVAKSHGLNRGIKEYDQCLKKLRVHCNPLSAKFRLEDCCSEDSASNSSTKQQNRRCTAEQGSQTAEAAASPAGVGVPLLQAVSNGPRAPPPPPPPLPGLPTIAKPGVGKAAAATNSAKAPPAPPPPLPGPPPPQRHTGPGKQQHGQQDANISSGQTADGAGAAAAAARPPPPPPPPLAPAFGRRKGPAAAVTAAAGSTGGNTPPPPPPGPPPSAAALRGTASAMGTEAAAAKCTSTAEQSAGGCSPPPPPPLPKQLRPLAAASEGMQGLAAVAAAAAAAAAANTVSAGSNSPAAEQEGLPPLNSCSSAAIAGGKLKTLHVDPVPVHRLADGSFWKVADPVAKPFKDSMEYLLRTMFSDVPRSAQKHHHHHSPRTSTPGTPGGASVPADGSAEAVECEVVTCVPEKRALHVEVVLKRLHMPAAALAAAINLLNTDKLKPDDLASIRSILPKPEELQAVREARETAEKKAAALSPRTATGAATPSTPAGSVTARSEGSATPSALSPRLGVVEAAFDSLGSVELLQAKMRAMEFRYDVESVASVVFEYARDIGHSLDVLRVSGQLQYLLAFVRDVANTMNRAGPKGPLAGFKLESLARLQSTKMAGATDLNLLHYIVAHMSAVLPGVLVLDAEREAFRSACRRGTFDTVTVRIRTLLDTQKRLSADLAAAKKLQQQRRSQQDSTPAATSSSNSLAAGAAVNGSVTPCSSNDSHDIYVARLTELLDNAAPKINKLQQQLDGVITKFKWTAEYYCEDVKGQAWKQQPVAFLTHFLELLDSLAATQKDTARLARVTSMLAEYVAAQQMWQQRQVLLEQDLLEQQGPQEHTGLGLEDLQRQEQEHQMLLQQQELLRQHLEASGRLHKQNGSSSSLVSDLPAGDDLQDEEVQQPHGNGSGASSLNSSAEHTQLYDAEDAAQHQQLQHKPAFVPRLELGGSSKVESTTAADAVCPEHSWGSVDSADHAGHVIHSIALVARESAVATAQQPLREQQQHVLGLSCTSPSQQTAHANGAEPPSVEELHGVEEQQLDAAAGGQHGTVTAFVTEDWSPTRSLDRHSVGVIDKDSSAMLDAAGRLAAEAAAVARHRAGAINLSRSLDSGIFAAVNSWHSKEEASTAAATAKWKQRAESRSSAAKPPVGSSTHGSFSKAHLLQLHQQQKLGLRQPWRSAGQKSSAQQRQRGKAGAMSPVSLRKRPHAEEQLACEAAAVATVQSRPQSASPTPKLSVQQQRLEALRLRGKRGTPQQQKQQQAAAGAGGSARSFKETEDPREKLARLLQSSIDSQA